MRYLEIIASCAEIATRAHTLCYKTKKHATRKDGVTPFIVHPARVASIVTSVSLPYQVVCAAWLHDVLEDTTISHEELKEELIHENIAFADVIIILHLVDALTKDDSKDRYGKLNSTIDKLISLGDLHDYYATSIKLADCIDNLSILNGIPSSFIVHHYIPETEYLLSELKKYPSIINPKLEYRLTHTLSRRKKEYGMRETSN
ncbi:MAG: HD domain-containing protein [Clostridia bacterium]|jgi:(p)ppGpp synthase/HD superfamily hydrolase|nr:HD domain-containing protein [Clostridia bacterium]